MYQLGNMTICIMAWLLFDCSLQYLFTNTSDDDCGEILSVGLDILLSPVLGSYEKDTEKAFSFTMISKDPSNTFSLSAQQAWINYEQKRDISNQ